MTILFSLFSRAEQVSYIWQEVVKDRRQSFQLSSSMTSELDSIAFLVSIQTNLYLYGGLILMVFGTIGSVCNLIVFTKKTLRKNPCSMYFIALNINDLVYIYTSILTSVLSYAFNITYTAHNSIACRFNTYMGFLLAILSPSYLIMSSVDRVLVTSRDARIRRRSTQRLAYICIIGGTLFWLLIHTHALFLMDVVEIVPNYFICYFSSNVYLQFTTYYQLVLNGILIPLCMVVLGLWAIRNVRSVRRARVAPVSSIARTIGTNNTQSRRSEDHQLAKMLAINVSIYIIFQLPLGIFFLYQQITQYEDKSLFQSRLDLLLLTGTLFGTYIPNCIGCYINLLVSKTFRKQLINTLLCK